MSYYTELGPNQARVQIDLSQIHGAQLEAKASMQSYLGGMTWKKAANGREYLVRITNRHGGSKSLGVRSPETEAIHSSFLDGKKRCAERLDHLGGAQAEHAAMARAIGLGRLPVIASKILEALSDGGVKGRNLMVIGTHAMYAYESAAGVRFQPDLMATMDIDFLWDSRAKMVLADPTGELDAGGLLALLMRADKSFVASKKSTFRAVNQDGFYVDIVKDVPNPPWKLGVKEKIGESALTPSMIDEMKWLLSSEKFSATVIDQSGKPVVMTSPDPRAFAVYKAWMCTLPQREAIKKRRDLLQSQACFNLVNERLQHLPFTDDQLRMFPSEILADARSKMDAPRA